MSRNRDHNLDRLRAAAIALVVVYHLVQMWPGGAPRLARLTVMGAYGVDLFFVLSGWLIGGLFWQEARGGRVDVSRFILRRVLRTVPCYFVALALAWGAVRVADASRSAFDFRYLVFLQNYEAKMPYFLVSWSLCIEEHFYLVVPILLCLILRQIRAWVPWLWGLCLVPILFRLNRPASDVGSFGSAWTSTHLRFEGLLAGVLAAWVAMNAPETWRRIKALSIGLGIAALGAAVWLYYSSYRLFYIAGIALLALGFLGILMGTVGRSRGGSGEAVVRGVAIGSYSAYLTHALMIHVARLVIARYAIASQSARFAVFIVTIVSGAAAFYHFVERPCLALRDRFVPRSRTLQPQRS
jgi:peptidoglycan/LPS O-acetylase OafA/YrhL